MNSQIDLKYKPVTIKEWDDFVTLFSEHGVQNGCWCMYWRITRSEFHNDYGNGNKNSLRAIIEAGHVPGILANHDHKPIGWCSVAPRDDFPVLERSHTLKRIDNKPVWSIVCFYISKPYRRKGITSDLIEASIDYVRKQNGKIIEAYPIVPEYSSDPRPELYAGLFTTYKKLGFKVALARSERKPIMRCWIK